MISVGFLCTSASAATATWTGAVDSNWNLAANWSRVPANVPQNGDAIVFNNLSNPARLNTNNNIGALSLTSLTVAATCPGDVSVAGGNLTISTAAGIALNHATAALTITANVPLGANQVWTHNSTGLMTVSGTVSGFGRVLTKAGSGTLVLSGNNTYSGGTIINAGVVRAGSTNGLSNAGNVTVNAGAALEVASGIAFPRNMTLNNGATLRGWGTSSATGTVTVAAGATVNLQSGGAAGDVFALGDAANDLTGGGAGSVLAVGGSGTVSLADFINNVTVLWRLDSGTLQFEQDLSLGNTANDVTFAGGSLRVSGTNWNPGATRTLSINAGQTALLNIDAGLRLVLNDVNQLTGPGSVEVTGLGQLRVNAAQNYGGTTTITDGTLRLGANNVLPDTTAVIVNSAAVDAFNLFGNSDTIGSLAGTGQVDLGAGTLTTGVDNTSTSFSGAIAGTGGLTKTGAGTLTLSGASAYIGSTMINLGVVNIQNAAALGGGGATSVASGAALEIQNNITVAAKPLSLSGTGVAGAGALRNLGGDNTWGGSVTLVANSTIAVDSGSLTLSGVVGGGGDLAKSGPGTLTLSSANTYTGATAVNAGTLLVNGSLAAGAGTTAVAAGATLGGTGSVRAISVASGGVISPGDPNLAGGIGTLNASSVDLSAGGVLLIQENGGSVDQLNVSGNLTLGGTSTLSLASLPPLPGTFANAIMFGTISGQFAVIDNPSTTMGLTLVYNGGSIDFVFSTANLLSITWAAGTVDGVGAKLEGDVSAAAWALGAVLLSTTRDTHTGGSDPTIDFVVRNIGTVNTALSVTCGSSAAWTLAAAPGANQFCMGVSNNDGASYSSLHAGGVSITAAKLKIRQTQAFDLQMRVPSSTSTIGLQTITVTITASAP